MNTAALDIAYRSFLNVRNEWISILQKYARYPSDPNSDEFVRPVAVIGGNAGEEAVLKQLEHLIVEWQRFHDLAEEYREKKISPIPFNMYAPVPYIAPEHDYAVVVVTSSANTVKVYVEKILSLIDKKIRIQLRARSSTTSAQKKQFISDELLLLEADRERFEQFPPSTLFVRRGDGYSNVQLKLKDEATQEEVNTLPGIFDGFVDRGAFRVGQYGCVIRADSLKYELAIIDNQNKKAIQASNIYANLTPVPCSALSSNISLYLHDDVEKSRERAAKLASERKAKRDRIYTTRSRGRRKGDSGDAAQAYERDETALGERRKNLSEFAVPIKKD